MKKVLTFILLLLVSSFMLNADNLNQQQLKLRNEIKTFLFEEGFMPEIDSDGDIHFKKEGSNFFVHVSSTDTAPMYVSLSITFNYPEGYTTDVCKLAANQLNFYKAVKTVCHDSGFSIRAEMFLNDPNQFKYSFYKHMEIIDQVREDFIDECAAVLGGRASGSSYSSSASSSSATPYLTVDGKSYISQKFSGNGGTATFTVSTNQSSWSTWGVPSWCSITNKTSTGFTLKCNANSSISSRSDDMKVTAGGQEVRIDVSQAGFVNRTGKIESVTVDHNEYVDGVKGMKIHVKFNIQSCKGESCRCIAYFYQDNGTSLKDTNSSYGDVGGNVCTSADFTPSYDSSSFGDLVLFIPNSELHVSTSSGKVGCYFLVRLYSFDAQDFIDASYKVSFSMG